MTLFMLPSSADLDFLAGTQLNQQSGHVFQLPKGKQAVNDNSLLDWDEGPLHPM